MTMKEGKLEKTSHQMMTMRTLKSHRELFLSSCKISQESHCLQMIH